MFRELFLTKEEEEMHQLEKIEKEFILSERDMSWNLEKRKIEVLDEYNSILRIIENYNSHKSSEVKK